MAVWQYIIGDVKKFVEEKNGTLITKVYKSLRQAEKDFEYIKKLNKNKDKKIAKHKDDIRFFIIFGYEEPIIKEYVENKIRTLGVI